MTHNIGMTILSSIMVGMALVLILGLIGVSTIASYVSLTMLRRDGDGDAELCGRTLAYCAFVLGMLAWTLQTLGALK